MAADVKMPRMGGGGRGGGPGGRFAPSAKPLDGKRTLSRILKIYWQWKGTIFLTLLLTALTSGLSVITPYLLGRCFDAMTADAAGAPLLEGALLGWALPALAAIHITSYLVSTVNGTVMLRLSQRLVYTLRASFFQKMQHLPLSYFDTHPHGDTMSRLTNDVDNISSTIASSTTQLLSSLLTLAGSLITMLLLNVWLTLTVLCCVPLVFLLTRVIARHSRAHFSAQQRNLGTLNAIIEESIQGRRLVKAFSRQTLLSEEFAEVNRQLRDSSTKAQSWAGFLMPLMNVINNLTFALVALVGGLLAAGGQFSVGVVVSFMSYSKQFAMPLNNIGGMFNTIQSALAGAERVFELLDAEEEPADRPDAISPNTVTGAVAFEDVWFSYLPERPVLKGISFSVKPGETIALVGETGSGKTTVVNLLTRFYDADRGRITLDGRDITALTRDSLRQCFSVVLQETCLFTGSVLDNIRYARPEATREEVVEAARIARADPFIRQLPKGYDTQLSAGSENLSQGQRQLLAIARAVLSGAPILLLDEATSSVDTKTEKEIQEALLGLMENRTSFLIAHRLSTIRDADRIFVIGDGTILEEGDHASLMARKGRYYQTVISQLGLAEQEESACPSL